MPKATLVPMGTITAQIGEMVEVGAGPKGTRLIVDVPELRLDSDRVKASLATKDAADWLTMSGEDGKLGALDVRFTLKTDDGAIIYVEYGGRADFSTGLVISAPTFQTSDERYQWLNRIQAVGAGQANFETGVLVYHLYEVQITAD